MNGRDQRDAGFTLLEVMLALALLALLSSALALMVRGAFNSVEEVRERGEREREWAGLDALFQRTFRTLPSSASVTTAVREEAGRHFLEVVIRDAPLAFAWGGEAGMPGTKILTTRPQVGGLVGLELSSGVEGENAGGRRALRLVSDLRKVEWRFYDPRSETWMTEWKETEFRPTLVEMTVTPSGDPNAVRWVFWMPPLTRSEG